MKRVIEDLHEQLQQQSQTRRHEPFAHGSIYSKSIETEDLKSPYELRSNDHRKHIADLKEEVNKLTESLQDIQHSLDRERREKNNLITSHNLQLSEMVNQIEELRSSRSNVVCEEPEIRTDEDLRFNRKISELERQLEREKEVSQGLERKCIELEAKLIGSEELKRKYVEELEILSQRIELQAKSTEEFQNESLISRLNSRISVLKLKEQKLYEENSKLETLYNEIRRYSTLPIFILV